VAPEFFLTFSLKTGTVKDPGQTKNEHACMNLLDNENFVLFPDCQEFMYRKIIGFSKKTIVEYPHCLDLSIHFLIPEKISERPGF
jgi:hypothetical protein